MPPTALGQDMQSKETPLYTCIRMGMTTSRTSIQTAASSWTEVSAGCSVPGSRGSRSSSNGYMTSLQRTNSAAAPATARTSSSSHSRLPVAPTAPAVLSRSAGTPQHSTSLGTTVAYRSNNSTPKHRIGVTAGLTTATTTAASPIPGRAKAVLASARAVNSSNSSTRAASMRLSPALVASTSNPKRALGSTGSYPAVSNAASTEGAAVVAKHIGSRASGLSTTLGARYGADAQATPLKQGLQRMSSGTVYSRTSIFDAVAVEQGNARPQVQKHGEAERALSMIEPLTYPGTTARSQSYPTAVQMAARSASAARSPGQAAQQPAAASKNALCGIGSPTNNGFLDRLHSKNQNLAAAAAGSGVSGSEAQVSSSGATSTFNVAMERLKALSFNHRDASRSGSSGAEAVMLVNTSSIRSDDSTSMQQQRPNISHGNTSSCSSCDPASAAAAAHASSVDALIARNREQFAESLPSLAMALAESGSGLIQGCSYSAVAASGAGTGTRVSLQGRISSESSLCSLSSPVVCSSSSRVHRQATAGGPTALDMVASRTAIVPAGMQGSLHSSHSSCLDGSKGLHHPPAAGVVLQQRPIYDPARYTTSAVANDHQQLSLATVAPSVEAVKRASSGGSVGGNMVNSRGMYTPAVAAASTVSPFAADQPVSPGSGGCSARSGNGGSHITGLFDGSSSSSNLHGGSAATSALYHSHQQQQGQASLARLTSSASSAAEASRQPSFLISTQPLSEDEEDSSRLAATSIGDIVGGAAARTSSLVLNSAATDAAELQSRQDFLAGNIASRSSKFVRPAAAAAAAGGSSGVRQSCHSGQAARQPHSRTQAGQYGSQELLQSQQQQHPHGRAAVPVVVCYSESDSDISEMSSSLEQLGSSSDDSDSDAGITAAAAARRRLVGHRVVLGSSISVSSTDGRSSSVGSGKELDVICSTGRHVAGAVAPANKGRGLPCGCVGLNNLGNTCFMNSILQCLNCLPELVVLLLGRRAAQQIQGAAGSGPLTTWLHCTIVAAHGVQWHSNASVGPAFGDLLAEMWSVQQHSLSRQRAISPRRFLRAVAVADERWGDGCQQDSQEFLHSLLEQLQSECNRVKGKPQYKELSGKGTEAEQAAEAEAYARSWHDSLVDDLFGGFLQSTVTCSSCHHQSHCYDPFLDLSVPIPNSKQVSVQDCLSAFVEEEILTGSEQVRCSACKQTCDATKRLQIFAYPKLLVLSLKRFNSCSKGGDTGVGGRWFGAFSPVSKNQTPVKIHGEQPLDLSPCCSSTGLKTAARKGCGKPRYELLAVSEHSGCLGGGHYTAQGRNVVDDQWYHFNDCSVTADSCPSGSSSSAYVLFYRLMV